jgi:hypothetical protein
LKPPLLEALRTPNAARNALNILRDEVSVIACKTMKVAGIEDYMRDIDRSLLRENLKLTPAQRLEKFMKFRDFTSELRRAGGNARQKAITDEAHRL